MTANVLHSKAVSKSYNNAADIVAVDIHEFLTIVETSSKL